MGRLHLMEFEDQSWCPKLLRDFATDILQFNQTFIDQSASLVPKLQEAIEASQPERIIDLCSGGSGPWVKLAEHLDEAGCGLPVCLSDKFPNTPAFEKIRSISEGRVDFVPDPIDATAVPADLEGLRTLFNGFHHFRPDDARKILADAKRARQPIAIFELIDRSVLSMIGVAIAGFIGVPLVTPFIRPFRWNRLLFTYLIPLVPLLCLWDGFVSCLRIYSTRELETLCGELSDASYQWDIGRIENSSTPIKATYAIGFPLPAFDTRGST